MPSARAGDATGGQAASGAEVTGTVATAPGTASATPSSSTQPAELARANAARSSWSRSVAPRLPRSGDDDGQRRHAPGAEIGEPRHQPALDLRGRDTRVEVVEQDGLEEPTIGMAQQEHDGSLRPPGLEDDQVHQGLEDLCVRDRPPPPVMGKFGDRARPAGCHGTSIANCGSEQRDFSTGPPRCAPADTDCGSHRVVPVRVWESDVRSKTLGPLFGMDNQRSGEPRNHAAADRAVCPGCGACEAPGGGAMTSPVATVNGRACSLDGALPHTSALDWLRAQGLTGAKEGCAEGECGACAVLVARPDGPDRTQWTAVNSCLVPALGLDGQEVVTSEGLGSPDRLHPVQQEMAVRGGSQCGYCTPGFVCSMAAEYYRDTRHSAADARDATQTWPPGRPPRSAPTASTCTHCRATCAAAPATGRSATRPSPSVRPPADDALATRRGRPGPRAGANTRRLRRGHLRPRRGPGPRPGAARRTPGRRARRRFHGLGRRGQPASSPSRRSSSASTGFPSCGPSMPAQTSIEIGRSAHALRDRGSARAGTRPPARRRSSPSSPRASSATARPLVATSPRPPPSATCRPALLALDATSGSPPTGGEREVAIADFFTGYRETVRRPGELIRSVRIPLPLAPSPHSTRSRSAASTTSRSVAVAMALTVTDGVVAKARIGLGGVAATPIRAQATESALEGRPWSVETVRAAAAVMRGEGTPMDDHRASAAYRRGDARHRAAAALRRRHHQRRPRHEEVGRMSAPLTTVPPTRSRAKPIPHESAALHVTGAALYTDDLLAAHPGRPPRAPGPGPPRPRPNHARSTRPPRSPSPESSRSSPQTTSQVSTTRASRVTSRSSRPRSSSTATPSAGCSPRPRGGPARRRSHRPRRPRLRAAALHHHPRGGDRRRHLPGREHAHSVAATSRPPSATSAHVFTGEIEFAGQEHFYLETHAAARPRRRGRAGLRPEQHPAPERDAGHRRARPRRARTTR